jgi:hypothetical protein
MFVIALRQPVRSEIHCGLLPEITGLRDAVAPGANVELVRDQR